MAASAHSAQSIAWAVTDRCAITSPTFRLSLIGAAGDLPHASQAFIFFLPRTRLSLPRVKPFQVQLRIRVGLRCCPRNMLRRALCLHPAHQTTHCCIRRRRELPSHSRLPRHQVLIRLVDPYMTLYVVGMEHDKRCVSSGNFVGAPRNQAFYLCRRGLGGRPNLFCSSSPFWTARTRFTGGNSKHHPR